MSLAPAKSDGLLDADDRLGPVITWRLDLRGRWQLILEHAPKKHDLKDIQDLRGINKDLTLITRDRNIIVHGLVHARVVTGTPPGHYEVVGRAGEKVPFVRVPCWTIFRGAEAGKSFPVSTKAVEIVGKNIQELGRRIEEFNKRLGYFNSSLIPDHIEDDWPKPVG